MFCASKTLLSVPRPYLRQARVSAPKKACEQTFVLHCNILLRGCQVMAACQFTDSWKTQQPPKSLERPFGNGYSTANSYRMEKWSPKSCFAACSTKRLRLCEVRLAMNDGMQSALPKPKPYSTKLPRPTS